MIKSLNGTPENSSPNNAMICNDQCITSDKRKADIFTQHYAGVSKVDMSKEDRTVNRNSKYLSMIYGDRIALFQNLQNMSLGRP